MAIYEYQCPKCGFIFEEYHKISSKNQTTKCPKCKQKAEKIISLSSFKINGFAAINGYSLANK